MVVKDRIVSWFIRNIVMPRMEIMDKPGFIVCQFSERNYQVFLRELFFSESLFIDLENQIVKKYNNKGRQVLYSIGKKFGYRYSGISFFPTIKTTNESEFKNFIYMFVRYAESMWSKELSHKINVKHKIFNLSMNDFIICKVNGFGYIMTEGSTTGFWSYSVCDPSIEGVQIKCQGRKDNKCNLICAPTKMLQKKKLKFFKETNLEKLEIDPNYKEINKIRESQFSKQSFKDLIDSGFFSYSQGIVQYKNERHFLCEASLMYILEKELKKLKGAEKILFEVSFNYGKNLIKRGQEETKECVMSPRITENFVTDYMSALGWGDILVLKKSGKYSVVSNYFPWTKWAKDIKFIMFRGIISGLLSEISNKKIILKKFQTDFSKGYISLFVSE